MKASELLRDIKTLSPNEKIQLAGDLFDAAAKGEGDQTAVYMAVILIQQTAYNELRARISKGRATVPKRNKPLTYSPFKGLKVNKHGNGKG